MALQTLVREPRWARAFSSPGGRRSIIAILLLYDGYIMVILWLLYCYRIIAILLFLYDCYIIVILWYKLLYYCYIIAILLLDYCYIVAILCY